MDRPHVREGSLIVMLGNITGIVFGRVDKSYYDVWTEGVMHKVHRDDFVILRTGFGREESED